MSHVHHHDHDFSCNSLDELKALIKYMVNHNEDHSKELEELAHELHHLGYDDTYNEIVDALKDFNVANNKLAKALERLNGK